MSRLTEKDKHEGGFWVKDKYGEDRWFSPKGKLYKPIAKLAHYEDMEEQGRLIEQKYGTWEEADDGDGVVCSVCRTDFCTLIFETDSFIYCPNCGAKLKELEGDHFTDADKMGGGGKHEAEVIGNIFDNPELMKGGAE